MTAVAAIPFNVDRLIGKNFNAEKCSTLATWKVYWQSESENNLFDDATKTFLKVALKQSLSTFMEP